MGGFFGSRHAWKIFTSSKKRETFSVSIFAFHFLSWIFAETYSRIISKSGWYLLTRFEEAQIWKAANRICFYASHLPWMHCYVLQCPRKGYSRRQSDISSEVSDRFHHVFQSINLVQVQPSLLPHFLQNILVWRDTIWSFIVYTDRPYSWILVLCHPSG